MAGSNEIIIGGDFNLLLDPLFNHSVVTVSRAPKALLMLQRMTKTLGLVVSGEYSIQKKKITLTTRQHIRSIVE